MNISKAQFIPIRQAFPKEAPNFTQWLAQNLDALSDRIGIQFNDIEPEKSVGDFKVDIFCKDNQGHNVIIENQLERTDHDHLGKVLTYMVNLDAKTAIWIATEARPEHEAVVSWLNQFTPVDMRFYFVKLEAIQIGDSVAPWFTVLVAPDEQLSEIGEQKKSDAGKLRSKLYGKFWWLHLVERSKGRTVIGIDDNKTYDYVYNRDGYGVRLTVASSEVYEYLYQNKDKIQSMLEDEIEWNLSKKQIIQRKGSFNYKDESRYDEIADQLIDMMIQFERVLNPYLKNQ